jgi:hypothetical protein
MDAASGANRPVNWANDRERFGSTTVPSGSTLLAVKWIAH